MISVLTDFKGPLLFLNVIVLTYIFFIFLISLSLTYNQKSQ